MYAIVIIDFRIAVSMQTKKTPLTESAGSLLIATLSVICNFGRFENYEIYGIWAQLYKKDLSNCTSSDIY